MAHKKYRFYAVASGVERGIFDKWESCRLLVDHFKGNCYKGFKSFEEAVIFTKEHMDAEESIIVEVGGNRTVEYVKDLCHFNKTA